MTASQPRPLACRIAWSTIVVVAVVVGLCVILLIFVTNSEIDEESVRSELIVASSIASAAADAYAAGGSWSDANTADVLNLAHYDRVHIRVVSTDGAVVVNGGVPTKKITAVGYRTTVSYGGSVVGRVVVSFPPTRHSQGASWLQARLAWAAGILGVVAVLLGGTVAFVASRRITRPIRLLTEAVHAVNDGYTEVRVGSIASSLELHQLSRGFDAMAASLEHQDQSRRNLAADVAHELRTPVAVLQATCEAVVDGVTSPSRALMVSMLEEVHRLSQRIADLDDLTSAESAGLRLTRSLIDLSDVAMEAASAASAGFDDAGVAFSTDLTPVLVQGDRHRLFQVMTNLLANSTKFTPRGGSVRLVVGRSGDQAITQVRDTGVGIEPDELQHVFERFWRGRESRGIDGSGIGLAIVSELVRAHRGTVTVRSVPRHGAEFTIRLPLATETLGG